ncbi:hypothetical protein DM02DRAFT_627125 [Periconia macrospinosa]|uniref:Uncharacterized protein n=1 Tax=Periconia macrospinosa TaxID=97972 RepID=A0A2V1DYX9_9PLEO|nr:hypothetical protein DM02DRAFT_627125 [Periconia macrospinosa]
MSCNKTPASLLPALKGLPDSSLGYSPEPSFKYSSYGYSHESWSTDTDNESILSKTLTTIKSVFGSNTFPAIPSWSSPDSEPKDTNQKCTSTKETNQNCTSTKDTTPMGTITRPKSPEPRPSSPSSPSSSITIKQSQPIDIPSSYNQELKLYYEAKQQRLENPDRGRGAPPRVHHGDDQVHHYYRSRHRPLNGETKMVYYKGAYQPLICTNPWEAFHDQKLRDAEANIGKMEMFNEPPVTESLKEFQRLPTVKLDPRERAIVVKKMRKEKEVELVPKRIPLSQNVRHQNMHQWAVTHPRDKEFVEANGCLKRRPEMSRRKRIVLQE